MKHSDNLSKTLQATYMSVVEARQLSELSVKVLQKMREEKDFDLFWELCLVTLKELNVKDGPVLDRQRKRPKRYEDGIAEPHFHEDPKVYYRSIYYQCLDSAISTITSRFHQQDYSLHVNLEQLLIKACSRLSADYKTVKCSASITQNKNLNSFIFAATPAIRAFTSDCLTTSISFIPCSKQCKVIFTNAFK